MRTPYDTDFYRWTQEQAALLREGALQDLDICNLLEEILSLGTSQKLALGSHLRNLMLHLLKWSYQPAGRQTGHSWRSSIRNARDEIGMLLEASPSLRGKIPDLLPRRYRAARANASDETGVPLATFPPECPWSVDDLLRDDFWPEA